MKKITTSLFALTLSILPIIAAASTYQYVDTGGRVQSVQANSPADAFTRAVNIDPHSGVMLVTVSTVLVPTSYPVVSSTSGRIYQYVNINGALQSVQANSPAEAFARAVNIDPHSGVMLVQN